MCVFVNLAVFWCLVDTLCCLSQLVSVLLQPRGKASKMLLKMSELNIHLLPVPEGLATDATLKT